MFRNKKIHLLFIIVIIVLVAGYIYKTNGDKKPVYDKIENASNYYINYFYGYAFEKEGFEIDNEFAGIKSSFYNDDTIVDIFYEDFKDTIHNSAGYVGYSNSKFKNSDYVKITLDEEIEYKNRKARIIKWDRKPLKYYKIDGKDFVHYAIIDIIDSDTNVYTIQINSTNEIEQNEYLEKFKLVEKSPDSKIVYGKFKRIENKNWSENTKNFYKNVFQNTDKTRMGIYEHSTREGLDVLKKVEEKYGIKFDYLLEYYSLSSEFKKEHIDEVYNDGRYLEFTFQTSLGSQLLPDMIFEIMDGKQDEKIEELAKVLNEIDRPVLFRFDNEMNGDWCSYNALHFNRDTRMYKEMWKYFHKKITELGADNVIFVFNPNEKSFPEFKWNSYVEYFPGEEYVDVIGVTGYNTGDYYEGEKWRKFKEIYDYFMPDYKNRFEGYDFYITEFGSSTHGGDRNAWLKDMFEGLNDYGLKVAIYWNGIDWDGDTPARKYKITDDDEAMKIIKEYMKK